jgi:hypothetical protein
MPSTSVVSEQEISRGLPTLSLYVAPEDLFDRATGILTNRRRHGDEWERPGTVSYFNGGRLLYSGAAGVRVHGGGSRVLSPRQGFRLYFRRKYGGSPVPPGLLFGQSHDHTLRVLVVHNDARLYHGEMWHLVNPLAYDIADAVGCITAPTRPVRFFLNGEFQGVFVLTEHVHPKHFFAAHGRPDMRVSAHEFGLLWRRVRRLQPLRMSSISRIVDLENLTRWFIATIFCATFDPFQGPSQFRDAARDQAQWFWVNWDMDGSFRDLEQDTFKTLLWLPGAQRHTRRGDDPRPYIMASLLSEDAQYLEQFKRVWVEVMNYRLTPAFLMERFEHYRRVAITYGVTDRGYLERIRVFLTERPRIVRTLVERHLQTSTVTCKLTTTAPVTLDGHTVNTSFDGYYFQGMRLALDVPQDRVNHFARWRINGVSEPEGQTSITVPADRDLTITAEWR